MSVKIIVAPNEVLTIKFCGLFIVSIGNFDNKLCCNLDSFLLE